MELRHRLDAILLLTITWLSCIVVGCEVDDVAVYKVNLRMLWSEERFPKDYPTNPKAQWSQVFGQSHNRSYSLYRLGEEARPLVRDFAQYGSTDELLEEGDEESKVYDQFIAPAVDGTGVTENVVFVDGGHSLVSLVCRMIPSPDWFIGVDGLDLCVDSSWVDQVVLDLDLLDAGAVNGLTFNHEMPWPTDPIEPVSRISSRNQMFTNSSFYYRRLRQLPPIAKAEFTKIKEYSTKELNDLARKDLVNAMNPSYKSKPYLNHQIHKYSYPNKEQVAIRSELDELKDLEEEPVGTPEPDVADNHVEVITKEQKQKSSSIMDLSKNLNSMDDVMLAVANGRKLGLGKRLPRHFKSRLHHAVNRRRRF